MSNLEHEPKPSSDKISIRIPRFLIPLHHRMLANKATVAKNNAQDLESLAQQSIHGLLETLVEVYPDYVDPMILETHIRDLSDEKIENIWFASGEVATGYLQFEHVPSYIKARKVAAYYDDLCPVETMPPHHPTDSQTIQP